MVIGEYSQKLGEKKRIAFPKKFRDEMGEKLIITKGYEKCLVIMSPARWEELVEKEVSGPFVSGLIRDTSRFLLGSASMVTLDAQGRFVLPSYLQEYSSIKQIGVFLGLGKWVELWELDNWDKKKELDTKASKIGEKLLDEKFYVP